MVDAGRTSAKTSPCACIAPSASAVAAIEERDGVRFYIDRTSPVHPIQLVRTPGFGGSFLKVP